MSKIIPFDFEGAEVRTVEIDGQVWVVGADVCRALGIANSRHALSRLSGDEKNTVVIGDGIPGNPNRTIINEPGVYRLIFTSRVEGAEKFKHWLAHEVLPAIRKTGSYHVASSEIGASVPANIRKSGYRLFEAVIRPDGPWGKIWAIPVYRLGETDYWNLPLLLDAYCGSREFPERLDPEQYAYDLMREHPELPAAGPLWVAHQFYLKMIIPAATGCHDKRTRDFLEHIENAHLTEKSRHEGNVVHLRDVKCEK